VAATACPFCFRKIDTSRLAYQCSGRGNVPCKKEEDPDRVRLTGSHLESFPTFIASAAPAVERRCPTCGGVAKRRACPKCHTVLPIDFVGSKSPMIGLVGAKGSGKTVLMTVLVKQLREVVGRRFDADIRIATDNPDGLTGLTAYQASREVPLYNDGTLPVGTAQQGSAGRQRVTPVVLRWRQESSRFGSRGLRSTVLSFVDTAGEDLNDQETAFTLEYISVCNALIIALDPFALPGARARLRLPAEATQVADDVPLDVVSRITELLRTEHRIKKQRRIGIPVAIVFTKIDAFYPTLDRQNPIMATSAGLPAYDNADGQSVHEHMLALLDEWHATDIDNHMRLNYSDYRYFGVSALGAEPDYGRGTLAPGGVRPHRVEDPVLWLMAKSGTVAGK
jgi:ABC-type dipeptide/oligopeptide/nickel transport system ATPase component